MKDIDANIFTKHFMYKDFQATATLTTDQNNFEFDLKKKTLSQ